MPERLVLMYTNGEKPFVEKFFQAHWRQAESLNMGFKCITKTLWRNCAEEVIVQRPLACTASYAGILEAILQGLEGIAKDTHVFLAEDDCLYKDDRFSVEMMEYAMQYPDCMLYQTPVSFICDSGFYLPEVNGLCLHSAYGTAAAMQHNIKTKWREFNGERNFPASSVEPVAYPSIDNPDEANKVYRTRILTTDQPVSIDFRGYGQQTWKPTGSEPQWQDDEHWGSASALWSDYIS